MKSILSTAILLFAAAACAQPTTPATDTAPPANFSGRYVEGEGDLPMLESLDAAFEMLRPSSRMATLPLTYRRDWNGLGEGSWWPGWWSQNAFGAAYAMQPFVGEEPYASWMANAYGMLYQMMGDGKTEYWPRGSVPPDGALADSIWVLMSGGSANGFGDLRPTIGSKPVATEINGKVLTSLSGFKQGDGKMGISDFCVGSSAASFIVECDRVLMRHDLPMARNRLGQFKRNAAFLDSRRAPRQRRRRQCAHRGFHVEQGERREASRQPDP